MADKDFRVDTDALKLVADRIKNLLDYAGGEHGSYPGSRTHFQEATEADMKQGLAPLLKSRSGGSADSFSTAYGNEHTALLGTYSKFLEQLQHLYTTTSTTATTFAASDTDSRQTVTNTTSGTEWG